MSWNPLESEGVEIRIVEGFPKSHVFERHAVAHPVADGLLGIFRFELGHVAQADIVLAADFHDTDKGSSNFECMGLFHVYPFLFRGVLAWMVRESKIFMNDCTNCDFRHWGKMEDIRSDWEARAKRIRWKMRRKYEDFPWYREWGEGGLCLGKRAGHPRSSWGEEGLWWRRVAQEFATADFGKDAHLLDGDFVEFAEALGLGDAVVDLDGVDVLQIGEADELVDGCVIAHGD